MQAGTRPGQTMFVMEGRAAESHELLPNTTGVYSFAQFYSAVFEVAKAFGMVKPTCDPKRRF